MPFGYIGQNQTKQKVKNSGVLSSFEISHLEKQCHAGGSLELIDTISFSSGVSTVSATNLQEDKYDVHLIHWKNFEITTSGGGTCQTNFQLAENGTFTTSGYQRAVQGANAGGSDFEGKSTSDSRIFNAYSTGNGNNINFSVYMYLYNAGDSSKYTFATCHSSSVNGATQYGFEFGSGVLPQASLVNGIRIIENNRVGAGNANISGTASLYGIAES